MADDENLKVWKKANGKYIKNAAGKLIRCAKCPCSTGLSCDMFAGTSATVVVYDCLDKSILEAFNSFKFSECTSDEGGTLKARFTGIDDYGDAAVIELKYDINSSKIIAGYVYIGEDKDPLYTIDVLYPTENPCPPDSTGYIIQLTKAPL